MVEGIQVTISSLYWQKHTTPEFLQLKKKIATRADEKEDRDKGWHSTSGGIVHPVPELTCNVQEADTRVSLHVAQTSGQMPISV